MKKSVVCSLAVGLALLGLALLAGHGAVCLGVSPAYLADGTGPIPPPIPMNGSGSEVSAPTYLADGTGPIPPPIPMYAA